MNEKLLLPAGSLLEFLGIATLLTNEGMFVPSIDLGFSIPTLLPTEIQGLGLLLAGGALIAYSIKEM